jgi:GTP pyrophosphokinase
MKNDGIRDQYAKELNIKNPRILAALFLALENHSNQFRKSGEPYIEHCVEVYKILKSWGVDNQELLIAAFLHDVIEDTEVKIPQITKGFGSQVSSLVESVTQFKLDEKENQDFRTLKKVINNSFVDPKATILKLADRYHNLSTLQYMPADKREKKAKESLEVYAKLAESLGLWVIKTEIEDLSFQYLYFDKFSKVKTAVDQDSRVSEKEVSKMIKALKYTLSRSNIHCRIETKKSGYYHAYQKLKQYSVKGISSNENYKKINDIIGYRVIVKTKEDCYRTLYAIHRAFGYLVDYTRFDEFIDANKRINGYEALQTTLDTDQGSVEIAIVTEDMENFNNWGYVYNLKRNIKSPSYNLKLVFTPNYDLVFLPEEAKAIDFAYSINTKLGDNSTQAYVNNEIKTLDYSLQNTDLVKVITGERTVEQDTYLSIICLPQTRNYIQKKIVESEKMNSIKLGKSILENHLAPRGILDLKDINQDILKIAYALGCENVEEIYYRASKGYLNIERLDSLLNEHDITKNKLGWTTIQVRGNDKPGILKLITDSVTKNKGNIIRITFQKENEDGYFYLRVVVENIKSKDLEKLKMELRSETNFKELKVV